RQFNTLVLQFANIGQNAVRQVGAGGNIDGEQQVAGIFRVVFDGTAQPSVPEAEIEADVESGGFLPFQAGVVAVGADGADENGFAVGVAELVTRSRVAEGIGRDVAVV